MIVASLIVLAGGICGLLFAAVLIVIIDEFDDDELSVGERRTFNFCLAVAGLAVGLIYGALLMVPAL